MDERKFPQATSRVSFSRIGKRISWKGTDISTFNIAADNNQIIAD